jgi:hypothetical protein
MTLFDEALKFGHSAEEILNTLSRSNKKFKNIISQAMTFGYPAEEILQRISSLFSGEKGEKFARRVGFSPSQAKNLVFEESEDLATGISKSMMPSQKERNVLMGLGKLGLGALGGAVGFGLAGLRGAATGSGLGEQILPNQPESMEQSQISPPVASPQSQLQPQERKNYISRALENINISAISPQIRNRILVLNKKLQEFEDKGIPYDDEKVQKVVGKIYEILEQRKPTLVDQETERFEKEYGKKQEIEKTKINQNQDLSSIGNIGSGIIDNFYEGIFQSLKNGKDTFSGVKDPLIAKAKPYFEKGLIKSPEDLKKFSNKGPESLSDTQTQDDSPIMKKLAQLPNGDLGEIESIKNGVVKLNVNGQVKHRKLSDVITEPEEVRLALNDILQIPESERSAAMDLLHYTPQHKLLHIMFPDGKIAWYEDVPEDVVDEILEAKGTPKTTGKTKTGEEWAAGVPESRFATVSAKITRNPKYSKDNEGITWGYTQKQYDKFKRLRIQAKRKRKESNPNP